MWLPDRPSLRQWNRVNWPSRVVGSATLTSGWPGDARDRPAPMLPKLPGDRWPLRPKVTEACTLEGRVVTRTGTGASSERHDGEEHQEADAFLRASPSGVGHGGC